MSISYSILLIGGMIIFLAVVGSFDKEDHKEQNDNYCDMVRLHKTSHGDAGWPDYEHSFSKRCI